MIRLKNLIREEFFRDDVPPLLYHATYKALLKNIKKHGIVPGGRRFRNFPECERGVYLGITPEYAGSMVEATENDNIPEEWLDDIIIFTVNTKTLNLSKLDRDPNVLPQEDEYNNETPPDETVYSYIYKGIIPFSSIIDINKYD